MKTLYGLVFFATGWGSTKGGINSFNFDLCCALGRLSDSRSTTVFCICPGTTTEEEKQDAANSNVKLIDIAETDFNDCKFDRIISKEIQPECEKIFWFGHDVITGYQACACRDSYEKCSKAVIFHHMNYREYYAIGDPERTARGEEKENEQKQIFKVADYAMAVGPKLFKSLEDLKTQPGFYAECKQIIPGLADIEPVEDEKHMKTILFTGRLENDNDPIKQYSITIYAVSDLFKNKDAKLGDVELKLYGLDGKTQEELNKKIEELKNKASSRAGFTVPIKPLPYTPNRNKLFEAVKDSSIVIMPSISEGFGLAAFEGIAAGVPTIISENSGLYEFLRLNHLDSYITKIEVEGGDSWESPNDKDVEKAYQSFKNILKNYSECKQNALTLRKKLLALGFTWEKTAKDIFDFIKIPKLTYIAKLLCGVINSEIYRKYSTYISEIANRCVDDFAQNAANEIKIDKDSILSLNVDTFLEIQDAIIDMASKKNIRYIWRTQIAIQRIILNLVQRYLKVVTDKLKEIGGEVSGLVVIDKKQIGTYKLEKQDEVLDVRFHSYDQFDRNITSIMEEANINAVLSTTDYELLKIYHKKLKETYNVLNFEGLSVMVSAGVQNIPLDKVYASMSLKNEIDNFQFEFTMRELEEENTEVPLFNRYKRLIIKGDPGSGKSTYLKKQLLASCDAKNKHICVFFKVSKYIQWISEEGNHVCPEQLSEYVYRVLTDEFCEENIEELKLIYDKLRRNGGVIYYIDGLDEVQDTEQKKNINQQIKTFVEESESCKFILTSRKVGLDEEYFKSMKFDIEEIAPLSKDSIKSYIKKWYEVVGQIPSESNRNYEQQARELVASINSENNSKLLNLAGNPLLLSIIVILHHHGINPPSNRAMLYSEITKTLLVTWMERRNFEIKYPVDFLNNFFSRVAFEIVTNEYSTMTIPESKLKAMYTKYLCDRNYDEEENVDNFIRYISDEAGILSPQGFLNNEQLYGFLMHRQIAEYYAAIALENKLNRHEIEFLSIINESKWTEVSILMGGYMSMQSDAGQDRVNVFIKKLFKTKSRPIEDFKHNILLILKWISNNTFISKDNLDSLLNELEYLFKSSNHYRVLKFCDDIVGALNNIQCKKQICDWLASLLDDTDFITVRNASVVINSLLKNKDLYKDVLEKITEDKIIMALKQLIENKEFEMLYRDTGCYHTMFMDYFIKCMNKYYDSYLGTKGEQLWHKYTSIYANAVSNRYIRHYGSNSIEDLIKLLEQESNKEKFNNIDIFKEYLNMLVLYAIGFEIVANFKIAPANYKDFCDKAETWNCKSLVDSAIKICEEESSLGEIAVTYVSDGIIIYHKKDQNGHKLTIFSYNRYTQQMEKYIISLKNNFCLDDIKNQVTGNCPLNTYHCLEQLSEIELSQEKLMEMFNFAYNNGLLLTKEVWHQSILEKISADKEAFYKYYDIIKRLVRFDKKRVNPLILKGEMKTYYKYFSQQRNEISASEIRNLIALYKKEDDDVHKNVLYDILYELLHSEKDV